MPQPPDYRARKLTYEQLPDACSGLQADDPLAPSADRHALNALRFAPSKHGLPDPAPVRCFALGDVVVLNSGGPLMTVTQLAVATHLRPEVSVAYVRDDGTLVEGSFPPTCLRFPTERELGV